jgi:hypothetical protein
MKPSLTAIIIAKNEEEMIANCLETLRWCDEIMVINNDSSDATVGIAHRLGARVFTVSGSFAEVRNEGLRRAKTEWVLYIDADERVTPALADDIRQAMDKADHMAYAVRRENILYGSLIKHGGWADDWVVRLFNRKALKTWAGEIHEHAEVDGSEGRLTQPLVHLTHRSITAGLAKTIEWTPLEAKQLYEAGIAPVTFWTLLRKGSMEVVRRSFFKKGYKDGQVGWVETFVQAINRMLVYMQVWELQQKPSLPDRYQKYESAIAQLWQQHQE